MLNLVYYPDPILLKPTEPVLDFSEIRSIVPEMFQIMKNNNGIGLSANQVGLNKSMFVMDVYGIKRVVINPVIKSSTGSNTTQEGCLSLPSVYVNVDRPTEIVVQYQDTTGLLTQVTLRGLEARCCLHELDHLLGKTFLDHLSKTSRSLIEKRLQRERQRERL